MGWKDTFEALMRKAVPEVDLRAEGPEHFKIRKENDEYKNSNLEGEISVIEIENAITRTRKYKAPGDDGIHNETLKHLWRCKGEVIYCLLNNCFRNVSFPRNWKSAVITFILKDKNKDKTNISSYRPISLLPTLEGVRKDNRGEVAIKL